MAKTLYEKLFDAHVVYEAEGETPILYIKPSFIHEVTSPRAFDGLRGRPPSTSSQVKLSVQWITVFLPKYVM